MPEDYKPRKFEDRCECHSEPLPEPYSNCHLVILPKEDESDSKLLTKKRPGLGPHVFTVRLCDDFQTCIGGVCGVVGLEKDTWT